MFIITAEKDKVEGLHAWGQTWIQWKTKQKEPGLMAHIFNPSTEAEVGRSKFETNLVYTVSSKIARNYIENLS